MQLDDSQIEEVVNLLNDQGYCTDEDTSAINASTIKQITKKWLVLREHCYTGGRIQQVSGHSPTSGTVQSQADQPW